MHRAGHTFFFRGGLVRSNSASWAWGAAGRAGPWPTPSRTPLPLIKRGFLEGKKKFI